MDIIKTLTKLTAAFGPSGCENEVSHVIEELATPYIDEISRDVLGNLIFHKKGTGPRVMFSAHMDSIGLIATHISENGFIRVGAIGSVAPRDVLRTPVRFQSGVRGTINAAIGVDMEKLSISDLFIDIGAASQEEAERLVQVGDAAVFDTPTHAVCNRIISPCLDNRVACLVLLMAMEMLKETNNDLYFVFSVQEEVGRRGAKTAAWTIAPDYGIAVDVTVVDDVPGSKHLFSSVMGAGASIKVMDHSVICHPMMVKKLMRLADERRIPVQRDVLQQGDTDAGPIHQTRAGVYTGGISIPCRYVHTPAELVDLRDVRACAELAAAFAICHLEN